MKLTKRDTGNATAGDMRGLDLKLGRQASREENGEIKVSLGQWQVFDIVFEVKLHNILRKRTRVLESIFSL